MAQPINAALIQGLGLLNAALGSPVLYWRGAQISCVPGSLTDINSVVNGGFTDGLVARLIVTVADWLTADQSSYVENHVIYTRDTTQNYSLLLETATSSNLQLQDAGEILLSYGTSRPIVGRTVVYQNRTLRIVSATEDSSQGFYRIDLAAPTK